MTDPIELSILPTADGGFFPSRIPKEAINALPIRGYEGPIDIISEDAQIPAALEELRKEKILGFDTESRPAFKKGISYPPALLQLSTRSKAYLFQLLRLEAIDPIWELLADPNHLKVGVAILDDIRKLQDRSAFEPKGFLEIATITRKCSIHNTGLRSLAALFLGFRISKRAQLSNWSKDDLDEIQIRYAATDAWVSREIFCFLQDQSPDAPFKASKETIKL